MRASRTITDTCSETRNTNGVGRKALAGSDEASWQNITFAAGQCYA